MTKYIPIAIGLLLLLAGGIYFVFSPEESALFPQCPFHTLTGWDCPGCGSQRAIHHLLHLRIKDAFLCNPLLMMAIPYAVAGIYLEYLGGKKRFPKARKALFGKTAIIVILILIILFWIGRNAV
ncbi:MAG: DUF2752 domain-containing protein [Prevotella sp.]|jgi:hypothetical protein|nr:DUF2752 domain-containing protein [Prevotella sp.]